MNAKMCFRASPLWASLALTLCFCVTPLAEAQAQPARERKNSVYAELLGSGFGVTFDYERVLTSRISARVGGGLAADGKPASPELTIGVPPAPSDYSLLAASDIAIIGQRHQLFAGAGARVLWIRYGYRPTETNAGVFGEIGYRYGSPSGFLFKATLVSASMEWAKKDPLWVYPGVSLGWSF